ncbi:hypothetical protein [Usitatibacter palustris]|uniref:Uncharacterized protein n=1 Tax=Usitatibacter palustris TaxID=2732487 RepID=A0A6M4H9A3_9PROT|nr:hypothetical protein [Usitatibacter palustris]QJR14964.1 hypothetical protein DSM104440_01779 [Usitatibacter palustris]
MPRNPRALIALAAGVALVLVSGCGKPPPPKVDAATEQAEARERAKQRAYGGDAVKALETAKGLESDLNRKAEEAIEKAEK